MWTIKIKRKLEREIIALPINVQLKFAVLQNDLRVGGPEQPSWSNYSKLGVGKYHCHLTHHYVACWKMISETELELEVYYVGSRENAPY